VTTVPREFTYRGYTEEELKSMSMDDFIQILPSRQRRSLKRSLTEQQRILIEKIREARKASEKGDKRTVKTHCRNMVIIPEMIGLTIHVHNGKEFVPVEVTPEKIGHYLGEFVPTNKRVVHGSPGIGASRSSMYVPLK
jgi:small subunit ribosomal protein S19